MRLLWAVSSVGLGHVMRDLAVVAQLRRRAGAQVDWLAPAPAGDFLRRRGCTVVPESERLLGSGGLYDRIFATRTDDFNLMEYVESDTRLHRHDFRVSAGAWRDTEYDAIVGDEAFWLLSGFASRWSPKPAPFVFLTDFIGTKAMTSRLGERLRSWHQNLRFTFSHRGPDVYLYIGSAGEILDEPLGVLLPSRRGWAERHCQFVKPVVAFDPENPPDGNRLRQRLGLPEKGPLFLATVGPQGDHRSRTAHLERVFESLHGQHPDATFVLVGPGPATREWIRHHPYLEPLHEYFAASDFVFTQSGYGKVTELLALGVPFVAIPLDHHFEQEAFMAERLRFHGSGRVLTLRDHPPGAMAEMARAMMGQPMPRIQVDDGREIADIVARTASRASGAARASRARRGPK
jgi:UDP:flavonoid glycosyltransferase YjiC (YdhE family)